MHIVHALFTRYSGGLEQAYVNVTESLASKGHKVTCLLRSEAPYKPLVEAHASEVITAEPRGFYDLLAVWHLRKMLRHLRPDLIIAHNGRAIAILDAARRGTGIPLCGASHSYKTRHAFRADRLVVLSAHMQRHFELAGYRKPMRIIPNAIHLPEALLSPPWKAPLTIGAIGRLSSEKGFADLLQALQMLKARGVAFTLKLAGDGPERQELQAQTEKLGLSEQVRFEGWLQDKAAFYSSLHLLCIPSREDSFPMVVVEGLAYGLPMVATDAPGPADMLTHEVNGLLVPRGNPAALADALHRLCTHPELASRLAHAARLRAETYSFPAVAGLWDEAVQWAILKQLLPPAGLLAKS